MKFGLDENVIGQVNQIFAKYPQIELVILYGSRAMGTQRKGSDIDIAIKGKNLDLELLSKMSDEIDDLLLPYKFDISIIDYIENQDLLNHIKRVGTEFYKKSPTN